MKLQNEKEDKMNKKSLLTVLTVSLVWIGTVFADIDIGNNGAGSIS